MVVKGKFLSVAPVFTLLLVPTGIQKGESSEDLGAYAQGQTLELPAEDIEPSLPYLGSPEIDSAVLEIMGDESCPQWVGKALTAGWKPEELPRLMRIMYRESRCRPDACGETDSPHIRKCRDWGLMQINDYSWKTTIRNMGMDIEQMHDPYWNLWFARWLFEYSLERNGDGWIPWKIPHK